MPARATPPARPLRCVLMAAVAVALASCGGSGATSATHTSSAPPSAVAQASAGATAARSTTSTSTSRSTDPTPGATGAAVVVSGPLGRAAPHLTGVVAGAGLTLVVDVPTGPFAEQNEMIDRGVSAAAGLLDANGGIAHHPLRVVQETLDGSSAAVLAQRLRAAGPNPVLVLPCDTNSESALAEAGEQAGVLELAPCAPDPTLGRGLRTFWPVGMDGGSEAQAVATYMYQRGYRRVFVVDAAGVAYSSTMAALLEQALLDVQVQALGQATVGLEPSAADIAHVVAQIRATHPMPNTIYTTLPPPGVARLMSGLRAAGLAGLYAFGTSALDVPTTLTSPGEAGLEQMIIPNYGFTPQDVSAAAFLRAYVQTNGHPPVGSFPGLGFDTVGVLEQAIAKAHSTAPSALERALSGGLSYAGAALLARSYGHSGDHNPQTTVGFERIVSDAFFPLLTMEPGGGPPPPPPTG